MLLIRRWNPDVKTVLGTALVVSMVHGRMCEHVIDIVIMFQLMVRLAKLINFCWVFGIGMFVCYTTVECLTSYPDVIFACEFEHCQVLVCKTSAYRKRPLAEIETIIFLTFYSTFFIIFQIIDNRTTCSCCSV